MRATTETAIRALLAADDEIKAEQVRNFFGVLRGEQKTPAKLITMKEAAARFGCTVRTVQRWCQVGELETIRRGRLVRIPEDALYRMQAAGGGE